jgi:hypothetical protein
MNMALSGRKSVVNIKEDALAESLLLAISAVCSLLTVCWMLWYCRYGIDFADEGFYLVWITDPFKYGTSVTQFGFVYHPLYMLLGRSIVALRLANILITFFLAWVLCNLFLREIFRSQDLGRLYLLTLSSALATASFTFLRLWSPTPSYNWLTFQALLVVAIGLLLAQKNGTRSSTAGWILIGVGGWLAFMAKPSSAAVLGASVAVYLLAARKLSAGTLAISLVTAMALLVLSAFTLDGSIMGFVDRLRRGVELAKLMGAGHSFSQIIRLDDFHLEDRAKSVLLAGTAVFFCSAWLSSSGGKVLRYGGHLLSIILAMTTIAIIFGRFEKPMEYGEFQHLVLWSVPFAAILLGFFLCRSNIFLKTPRSHWALGSVFLVFPHVFAFGTSNNYWWFGGLVCIFWILAGFIFLGSVASSRNLTALLLPLGLAVQLMTATQVFAGIEGPYYQPQPLHADDRRVKFGEQGGTILLPRTYGRYIEQAIDIASQARFKKGTPMIDISGHSPGVLYAIGASNTGLPWLYGNYPGISGGGEKMSTEVLKGTPCDELASAWLLAEPLGPVRMSPQIIASFGANLATDYEVVGTFETAPIVGGFTETQQQQILKPVRAFSVAKEACEATRALKK